MNLTEFLSKLQLIVCYSYLDTLYIRKCTSFGEYQSTLMGLYVVGYQTYPELPQWAKDCCMDIHEYFKANSVPETDRELLFLKTGCNMIILEDAEW